MNYITRKDMRSGQDTEERLYNYFHWVEERHLNQRRRDYNMRYKVHLQDVLRIVRLFAIKPKEVECVSEFDCCDTVKRFINYDLIADVVAYSHDILEDYEYTEMDEWTLRKHIMFLAGFDTDMTLDTILFIKELTNEDGYDDWEYDRKVQYMKEKAAKLSPLALLIKFADSSANMEDYERCGKDVKRQAGKKDHFYRRVKAQRNELVKMFNLNERALDFYLDKFSRYLD